MDIIIHKNGFFPVGKPGKTYCIVRDNAGHLSMVGKGFVAPITNEYMVRWAHENLNDGTWVVIYSGDADADYSEQRRFLSSAWNQGV